MLSVEHAANGAAFGEGQLGIDRQRSLYDVSVGVVGGDGLGQMLTACLSGLGVGSIYYFDEGKRTHHQVAKVMYGDKHEVKYRDVAKEVREGIAQLSPRTNMRTYHSVFSQTFVYDKKMDIVIDASNDPVSKKKVLEFARSSRPCLPFLSLSSTGTRGKLSGYWPDQTKTLRSKHEQVNLDELCHEEFIGKRQGGCVDGMFAGLAAEEVRKLVFSYGRRDRKLSRPCAYNIERNDRVGLHSDYRLDMLKLRKTHITIVGAGALGNWAALYLALHGCGQVEIIDSDTVEVSNLNRQLMLRGRIGACKSEVLSERIKEITASAQSFARRGFVQKEIFELHDDTIILGCVDNVAARKWMSDYAHEHDNVYIDGGTHPKFGQIAAYIPGQTRTIDEQLNLSSFPEVSRACRGANPSVVMSNAIIASMMVGELLNHVGGGTIQHRGGYDTELEQRVYVERPKCRQ